MAETISFHLKLCTYRTRIKLTYPRILSVETTTLLLYGCSFVRAVITHNSRTLAAFQRVFTPARTIISKSSFPERWVRCFRSGLCARSTQFRIEPLSLDVYVYTVMQQREWDEILKAAQWI